MRQLWRWSLCALASAALLVTWSAARAEAPAKGKITGVVLKEGKAVSGVQVRLMKPPQGPRPPQDRQQQAAEPGEGNPPPAPTPR